MRISDRRSDKILSDSCGEIEGASVGDELVSENDALLIFCLTQHSETRCWSILTMLILLSSLLMPRVGAVDSMPHELKFFLKHFLDNVFWAFLILMIIAGTVIDAPFVNVGLTAR